MTKKEFREIFLSRKQVFRTTRVYISSMTIFRVIEGCHSIRRRNTFSYTGEHAAEKTLDYAWKNAKKAGWFEVDGIYYCLSGQKEYTARYMHDGKLYGYSFRSTSDSDAIKFANWKLGRVKMAVIRHEEGEDIQIYNSLEINRL